MNIYDLIEMLEEQENKERTVLVGAPAGWFSVCEIDSGEEEIEGETYFILKPCYGHNNEKIEIDIRGGDFEIDKN